MKTLSLLATASALLATSVLGPTLRADDAPASKDLIDFSSADSVKKLTPDSQSGKQITLAHSDTPAGVTVTVAPGDASYPGVDFHPDTPLDLSAAKGVAVTITNTSDGKLSIGLRVDDSGGWQDNNSEMGYLEPGETKTVTVTFGISFGKPGFNVNKSSIAQILIMTDKAAAAKSFRIEAIKPVAP
jgi:hypothetical protein